MVRKYKIGLFFVLSVFPFLRNASIQIAAAEMSPPPCLFFCILFCLSQYRCPQVSQSQAFRTSPLFVSLNWSLSAQGNKRDSPSGSSTYSSLNCLVFFFCLLCFCFYHIMPFLSPPKNEVKHSYFFQNRRHVYIYIDTSIYIYHIYTHSYIHIFIHVMSKN